MRSIPSILISIAFAIMAGISLECRGDDHGLESSVSVFDANPKHLWNRIHATFFVRTGPDGKVYGVDHIEPLLWPDSRHLSDEASGKDVEDTLRELTRSQDDPCFRDPLKRAILQRDLWLVASWRANFPDAKSSETFKLLAKAIAHLALTPEEIARLPDNYADAIKARKFPAAIDPERLSAGYLPADLFDPQGGWVCVGRTDKPTAPSHLSKQSPFTNSVFFVFMKHAEGRDAGSEFLKKLTEQTKPLLMEEIDSSRPGRLRTPRLNLQAPQLPIGSQLALVRRMMLIDNRHQIVASPITESVQFREITAQAKPNSVTEEDLKEDTKRRADFKIELSRVALFRQKAGGLHDVSDNASLRTGFLGGDTDPFQRAAKPASQEERLRTWREFSIYNSSRETCALCHPSATTYGTLSFQRPWSFQMTEEESRQFGPMFPVSPMTIQEVERRTIRWKEQQPEWALLKSQFER